MSTAFSIGSEPKKSENDNKRMESPGPIGYDQSNFQGVQYQNQEWNVGKEEGRGTIGINQGADSSIAAQNSSSQKYSIGQKAVNNKIVAESGEKLPEAGQKITKSTFKHQAPLFNSGNKNNEIVENIKLGQVSNNTQDNKSGFSQKPGNSKMGVEINDQVTVGSSIQQRDTQLSSNSGQNIKNMNDTRTNQSEGLGNNSTSTKTYGMTTKEEVVKTERLMSPGSGTVLDGKNRIQGGVTQGSIQQQNNNTYGSGAENYLQGDMNAGNSMTQSKMTKASISQQQNIISSGNGTHQVNEQIQGSSTYQINNKQQQNNRTSGSAGYQVQSQNIGGSSSKNTYQQQQNSNQSRTDGQQIENQNFGSSPSYNKVSKGASIKQQNNMKSGTQSQQVKNQNIRSSTQQNNTNKPTRMQQMNNMKQEQEGNQSQNQNFGSSISKNKMNKASRLQQQQNLTPGPGGYEIQQQNFGNSTSLNKMSKASRMQQQNPLTPGPGMYESSNHSLSVVKTKGQAFVFGTEQRNVTLVGKTQIDLPGPGNYSSRSNNGGPSYQFGTKSQQRYNEGPGPGSYDANQSSVKSKNTFTFKFGSALRNDIVTSKSYIELPGPGNYNNQEINSFGKNAVKVSIQGKANFNMKNNGPGPGSYDQNFRQTRDKSQSTLIGTSKRSEMINMRSAQQMPGPGNYSTIQEDGIGSNSISYTFKGKGQQRYNQNPGPGSYNQQDNVLKSGVISQRWGQGKRETNMHSRSQSDMPGPGNYNNQDIHTIGRNAVKVSIKGKDNYQFKNEAPGPGSYDETQSYSVTRSRIQTVKIGTGKRRDIINEKTAQYTPGPGNYSTIQENGIGKNSTSYTFKGKESQRYNQNPGPGSYSQQDNLVKSGAISQRWGQGQRDTNMHGRSMSDMPGPGNYNSQDIHSIGRNAIKVSITGKDNYQFKNDAPGPGSYDQTQSYSATKSRTQTVKIGTGKRSEIINEKAAQYMPGPGNYTSIDSEGNQFGSKVVSFTFNGKSQQRYNENPGPGSYNQQDNLIKSGALSQRWGQERRTTSQLSKSLADMPGPGNYNNQDINSIGRNAVKVSIRGKDNYQFKNEAPGPGSYDQTQSYSATRSRVQTVKIGTSKRSDIINEKAAQYMPGPGNYSTIDENGNGFGKNSIGFTFKGKATERYSQNPGPGSYDQSDILTKSGGKSQRWSQEKRETQKLSRSLSDMPGPGNYEEVNSFGKNALKVRIQGKGKEMKYSEAPGPGSYDQYESFTLTKERTQTVKIGSSKRSELINEKAAQYMPGPGNYSTIDEEGQMYGKHVVSFTFNGKKSDKYNQNPGPGSYDKQDILTRSAVKAQKWGQEKRETQKLSRSLSDMPGPGNYNNEEINSFGKNALKVSIRGKARDSRSIDVPGPGSYDQSQGYRFTKERVQTVKIGSSKRSEIINEKAAQYMPGPGNYSVIDEENSHYGKNVVSYTFSGKQTEKYSQNPGPGSYDKQDVLTRSAAKSQRFGQEKRETSLLSKSVTELPGPGNYSNEEFNSFGKNAQKIIIQGKAKDMKYSEAPGPGSYDYSESYSITKDRVQTTVIGSSQRIAIIDEKAAQYMPGPGNYATIDEEHNQFGNNTVSYTFSGKSNEKYNQNPGPGSYNQHDSVTKNGQISQRFGTEKRETVLISKQAMESPGPGNYNSEEVNSFGKNTQKITIQGKSKDMKYSEAPGPGSYEHSESYSVIKDKTYTAVIGTSQRTGIIDEKVSQYTPGPGNYATIDEEHNQFGSNTVSYTFNGKVSEKYNQNPGPGSYDQNDEVTKHGALSQRFGSEKRETLIINKQALDSPGPGNYSNEEVNSFGKNAQKVSIQGKSKDMKYSEAPGPGSYELYESFNLTKDKVQQVVIGSSQRTAIIDEKAAQYMPGPGNYGSIIEEDGSIVIGKNVVSYTFSGKQAEKYNQNPGPGSYDQHDEVVKGGSVSQKFGSEKRETVIISKQVLDMPGPGNYDQYDTFGNSGTSALITGKVKETYNNNPGPGQYEQDSEQVNSKSTTIKIGSSTRQEIISKEASQMPGPGNYDNTEHHTFGATGTSALITGKVKETYNNNPGPGAYDLESQYTKEKVTTVKIGSSQREEIIDKKASEMPGPGNYDQYDTFGNSGTAAIIQGKEKVKYNNNPGPGAYEQDNEIIKNNQTSVKFSQSTRQEIISKETQQMPGPGNYDNIEQFGTNGTSALIQGKEQTKYNNNPGPGTYNQDSEITKVKTQSVVIGSSTRQDIVEKSASDMPGPGNYDQYDTFGNSGTSALISGKDKIKYNNNPGPGQYEQNSEQVNSKSTAVIIGSSTRQEFISKEVSQMPGPGNYDDSKTFGANSTSAIIQGKEKVKYNNNPGPGQYEQDSELVQSHITNVKIGSSGRQDIVSKEATQMPGPGNYDQYDTFGNNGTSALIQGKETIKYNNNPGPGTYQQDSELVHSNAQNTVIGSSTRQDFISKEVSQMPGPGNYDNHQQFGNSGTSAIIQGKEKIKYNNNPGPGQYEQDSQLVQSNATTVKIGSSTRQEIVSKDESQKPGPGNYEQYDTFGNNGTSAVISGKEKEKYNNNPGPGTYQQDSELVQSNSGAVKIGSSTRQEIVTKEASQMPGPGNYDGVQTFGSSGTSAIITGKETVKFNNNPGPGQYEQDSELIKSTSGNIKIGSSTRQEFISKEAQQMPGPGNYDSSSNFGNSGNGAIITGKQETKYNNFPGPGHYNQDSEINMNKSPEVIIGSSTRQEMISKEASQMPGPGNYGVYSTFENSGSSTISLAGGSTMKGGVQQISSSGGSGMQGGVQQISLAGGSQAMGGASQISMVSGQGNTQSSLIQLVGGQMSTKIKNMSSSSNSQYNQNVAQQISLGGGSKQVTMISGGAQQVSQISGSQGGIKQTSQMVQESSMSESERQRLLKISGGQTSYEQNQSSTTTTLTSKMGAGMRKGLMSKGMKMTSDSSNQEGGGSMTTLTKTIQGSSTGQQQVSHRKGSGSVQYEENGQYTSQVKVNSRKGSNKSVTSQVSYEGSQKNGYQNSDSEKKQQSNDQIQMLLKNGVKSTFAKNTKKTTKTNGGGSSASGGQVRTTQQEGQDEYEEVKGGQGRSSQQKKSQKYSLEGGSKGQNSSKISKQGGSGSQYSTKQGVKDQKAYKGLGEQKMSTGSLTYQVEGEDNKSNSSSYKVKTSEGMNREGVSDMDSDKGSERGSNFGSSSQKSLGTYQQKVKTGIQSTFANQFKLQQNSTTGKTQSSVVGQASSGITTKKQSTKPSTTLGQKATVSTKQNVQVSSTNKLDI